MMNKISRLLVLALLGCCTVASADGITSSNRVAVTDIGSILSRQFYTGVTPNGAPCRVEIAKVGGFVGGPYNAIYLTGYDFLPGFPVQRVSGYFQIGMDPRLFVVQSHQGSPNRIETSVLVPNLIPQVGGISTWQGDLTIGRNDVGLATFIQIFESSYDPISNLTSTRRFYCGEHASP